MGKYSIEQIKALLENIENEKKRDAIIKSKRRRISIALDEYLIGEIDRRAIDLRYISRNEFITSILSQFFEE